MRKQTQNHKDAPAGNSRALDPAQFTLRRPLVLVGLMGAGKSAIGKRVAAALSVPFFDADSEIEKAAGRSVSEIFAAYGEAHFRDGERKVIARLLEDEPMVLATGGGAFMNAETRALVKAKAVSMWLKADLNTLVRRTARRDTRPLLREGNPRTILKRLIAERHPVYAEADITVISRDGPHDRAVNAVIAALKDVALTPRAPNTPNAPTAETS